MWQRHLSPARPRSQDSWFRSYQIRGGYEYLDDRHCEPSREDLMGQAHPPASPVLLDHEAGADPGAEAVTPLAIGGVEGLVGRSKRGSGRLSRPNRSWWCSCGDGNPWRPFAKPCDRRNFDPAITVPDPTWRPRRHHSPRPVAPPTLSPAARGTDLVTAPPQQKAPSETEGAFDLLLLSSGGGIRTCDLRVMSPASYRTAPPRVACTRVRVTGDDSKSGQLCPNGNRRPSPGSTG